MTNISTNYFNPVQNFPTCKKKEGNDRKPKYDDIVLYSAKPPMANAQLKMSPKEALEWIAVVDALGGLVAKFGPDILNVFRTNKDQPECSQANDESDNLSLDEVA